MSRPKQYPIAARIKSCADLRGNEKALLIEICTMFTLGSRKICDAKNQHFVDALSIDKDTVGRVLARLEAKGYVTVDPGKERGNKRTIVPTTFALALYLTPSEIAALSAEKDVLSPIDELALAIDDYRHMLSTICGYPIDETPIDLSTIRRLTIDDSSLLLLIVKEFKDNLNERVGEELRSLRAEKKIWDAEKKKKEGQSAFLPANAEADERLVVVEADEPIRVLPFIADLSKPDDEWGQWQAVPRDVAMVDDYLHRINHVMAGHGHDFFNFYAARDWKVGVHQTRCTNWKSLLARWEFKDVKKQLVAQGGHLQQRLDLVNHVLSTTEYDDKGKIKRTP